LAADPSASSATNPGTADPQLVELLAAWTNANIDHIRHHHQLVADDREPLDRHLIGRIITRLVTMTETRSAEASTTEPVSRSPTSNLAGEPDRADRFRRPPARVARTPMSRGLRGHPSTNAGQSMLESNGALGRADSPPNRIVV
jgi:hypothetical protein